MDLTASDTTNRETPFLALSVEIRHHIYCHLLLSRDGFSISSVLVGTWKQIYHFRRGTTVETGTIHPDILLTCKKIYDEANPILYAENSFLVMDPDEMLHFTEPMGSLNFSYLRTLHIVLLGFPTKDKNWWMGCFVCEAGKICNGASGHCHWLEVDSGQLRSRTQNDSHFNISKKARVGRKYRISLCICRGQRTGRSVAQRFLRKALASILGEAYACGTNDLPR